MSGPLPPNPMGWPGQVFGMIGRILFRIGPVCPFFRVGKCGIEKNAQSHKDGFRHLEIVVRHPMGRSAIFNLLFFILTLTFNKGKNLSGINEKITVIPERTSMIAGQMSIIASVVRLTGAVCLTRPSSLFNHGGVRTDMPIVRPVTTAFSGGGCGTCRSLSRRQALFSERSRMRDFPHGFPRPPKSSFFSDPGRTFPNMAGGPRFWTNWQIFLSAAGSMLAFTKS